MGDARRFDTFAKLIAKNIPVTADIADVAGGKGYLQAALRQRGYKKVTSWDKRKRCATGRAGYRYGWFDHRTAPAYDAVVAMHPDEGTDEAIVYACKHRVPALVCPCCIKPSAEVYWGDGNYKDWCAHLTRLAVRGGMDVTWTTLPIQGRNDVMILRPARPKPCGSAACAP